MVLNLADIFNNFCFVFVFADKQLIDSPSCCSIMLVISIIIAVNALTMVEMMICVPAYFQTANLRKISVSEFCRLRVRGN